MLNRSDIVNELAARFPQLSLDDADAAVSAILLAISQALAKGHRIEVRGFGTFALARRAPRKGRNPRTGDTVHIPSRFAPHFKVGKALHAAVQQESIAANVAEYDSGFSVRSFVQMEHAHPSEYGTS